MKECDILGEGGQNILSPLLHIFRGSGPPQPHDLHPRLCYVVPMAGDAAEDNKWAYDDDDDDDGDDGVCCQSRFVFCATL